MSFKEAEFEDVEWTNKTQGKEKVNTIMNLRIHQ